VEGGIGHQKQLSFIVENSKFKYSYGGELRKKKSGRGQRPLSKKDPLHLVFKADKSALREKSLRGYRGFSLVNKIIKQYASRFYIKVDQISVQNDHIHLLIRCQSRFLFHHFFRVTAGQIAQTLMKEGLLTTRGMTDTPRGRSKLWKHRPFSRIVKSWKAYRIVKNYILLNEKEVCGLIKYRPQRLKGLSAGEWQILRA
jgi:putative transposase